MSKHNYAFKDFDNEHMSRAVGRDLGISTKHAINICTFIRGKNVQRAKDILKNVIEMKQPVPYKRFNHGVGHRPGIGPGRYPIKASENILGIIESAEVNAQQKGLNTSNLSIRHICAQYASRPMHSGRQRRVKMKRTHVEVVLEEQAKKETTKEKTPEAVKEKPVEIKKEAQKKEIKSKKQPNAAEVKQ